MSWLCNWLRDWLCPRPPAPLTQGEIDSMHLFALLTQQLGGKVYLSDQTYKLVAKAEMQRFLAEDKTDLLRWVAEYHDCDDFSFRLMGNVSTEGWSAIAFGIIWVFWQKDGNLVAHALNCFVDNEHKVWLIEPQTDAIFAKPAEWQTYFTIM